MERRRAVAMAAPVARRATATRARVVAGVPVLGSEPEGVLPVLPPGLLGLVVPVVPEPPGRVVVGLVVPGRVVVGWLVVEPLVDDGAVVVVLFGPVVVVGRSGSSPASRTVMV